VEGREEVRRKDCRRWWRVERSCEDEKRWEKGGA